MTQEPLQNRRRTKIVCTIGPSSQSLEMVETLCKAGMDVARLNFSHGAHEVHASVISHIREVSKKLGRPITILQDLQGPKIRVGRLQNDSVTLTPGQIVRLAFGEKQIDARIPIDYRDLAKDTTEGSRILLDDGLLSMKVNKIDNYEVECEVIHGGLLKSRKGVNFPDNELGIPAVTEKDTHDLLFGISQGVDYVALSFVQKADDIVKLKQMLQALGSDSTVVAKIELMSAVRNIDEICIAADAIMVARGDLGVECGFAQVAFLQKQIVAAARRHGKPVIVATQMLDSMIRNRMPTKAEVCDVANAVFDTADATMLSGESASGKYPENAVLTMADIVKRVNFSGKVQKLDDESFIEEDTEPSVIARTVVAMAAKTQCAAIITLTLTGSVARAIAKYRPNAPIIAVSPRSDVVRRLNLVHGVYGVLNNMFYETDKAISQVTQLVHEQGLVKSGDLVLITGGIPIAAMQRTNSIKVQRV